jgi:transcription elongation factor Elf1
MSPEVQKLVSAAIINYLGGQKDKFIVLTTRAMQINGDLSCPQCGELMVHGRIGNKKYKENVHLCVNCGQVVGKNVDNVRRYKAC